MRARQASWPAVMSKKHTGDRMAPSWATYTKIGLSGLPSSKDSRERRAGVNRLGCAGCRGLRLDAPRPGVDRVGVTRVGVTRVGVTRVGATRVGVTRVGVLSVSAPRRPAAGTHASNAATKFLHVSPPSIVLAPYAAAGNIARVHATMRDAMAGSAKSHKMRSCTARGVPRVEIPVAWASKHACPSSKAASTLSNAAWFMWSATKTTPQQRGRADFVRGRERKPGREESRAGKKAGPGRKPGWKESRAGKKVERPMRLRV